MVDLKPFHVHREHLQIAHRLEQHALKRLENMRLAVIGRNDHGYEGAVAGRLLIGPYFGHHLPAFRDGAESFQGGPPFQGRPAAARRAKGGAQTDSHRCGFM